MKSFKNLSLLFFFAIFLSACHTDPVENYFVKATESPDFFVLNIPANIITFDESELDAETLRQIHSIKKMNVLVYKNNKDIHQKKEKFEEAKLLLHGGHFKLLTKIKNEGYQVLLTYDGLPDKIEEIIFLGKDKQFNFLLGRIKGKDLNVNNILKALKHVQKVDRTQAESVLQIFKQP